MTIALWILQVILAAVFAAHGWLLVSPPPELLTIINEEMGVGFRLFLGVAEIAGAIGILLPAAMRVMPWLTQVTAACLAFVMVSATVLHLSRGEFSSAAITTALLLIASFVAYERAAVRPISARHRGDRLAAA